MFGLQSTSSGQELFFKHKYSQILLIQLEPSGQSLSLAHEYLHNASLQIELDGQLELLMQLTVPPLLELGPVVGPPVDESGFPTGTPDIHRFVVVLQLIPSGQS